jgi:hypothetical protein
VHRSAAALASAYLQPVRQTSSDSRRCIVPPRRAKDRAAKAARQHGEYEGGDSTRSILVSVATANVAVSAKRPQVFCDRFTALRDRKNMINVKGAPFIFNGAITAEDAAVSVAAQNVEAKA